MQPKEDTEQIQFYCQKYEAAEEERKTLAANLERLEAESTKAKAQMGMLEAIKTKLENDVQAASKQF